MKTKGKAATAGKLPAGFDERGGNFPSTWEPEVGATLQGIIREYKTVKTRTKAGESDVVIVRETGTNLDFSVWVSAGLRNRITAKDKGKRIFLRRTADLPPMKKGRNPMKTYQVGIK